MRALKAYLRDEGGQTSTEYILLLAVVALIVIKFGNVAKERIVQITQSVFGAGDAITNKITGEIDTF